MCDHFCLIKREEERALEERERERERERKLEDTPNASTPFTVLLCLYGRKTTPNATAVNNN